MILRAIRAVGQRIDSYFCEIIAKAVFQRAPFDYISLAYLKAGMEAADFFTRNMPLAEDLVTKAKLLEFAASQVAVKGLWLEFGVFQGRDIRVLSKYCNDKVYGFDSFEGLPEDWTFFQRKGRFSLSGDLPQVPENVKLVKGWFEETLPSFLDEHEAPIAFVHIDSDLYSSAKYVLFTVVDRLQPGAIIVFDDFLNYPNWQNGEAKAFFELIEHKKLSFSYIGFSSKQQSIAVRITD